MRTTDYCRTKADKLALQQGCYFDADLADRPIRFAERFLKPQTVKGKFVLLPWQQSFLRQLYGWRLPDGRRRWRKALLSTAKKNGKTLLTSLISLYELLSAGVPSPLVVSASTTRDNASQIYKELQHTIRANDKLTELCKLVPSWKLVRVASKNAEYRSLSADSGNAEGLNLSCCVVDEAHAHRSAALYRSLEYATVARPDGMMLIISTAGHDQTHFFFDLWVKARNILEGSDLDTSFYAEVHTAPEGQEEDPKGWALANPSLGVSFSESDFARDLSAAKGNQADWLSFRRYRLNQFCQSENAWLDLGRWDSCKRRIPEDELRSAPMFAAADLSQTTDLSAVVCCWALGGKRFYIRPHAWVCEEGVRKREQSNLPKYRQFAADGDLTITPGDVADYPRIKQFLLDLRDRYNLREVIFDQWNAIEMATELMSYGLTVYRFPQTVRHYTSPCKEWERAIAEGRCHHDGNSLMRWQCQNVSLYTDPQGNCMPSRKKSTDKIDCVVAALMAFSRAVETSAEVVPRRSVYDSRGLVLLS